MKVLIVIAGILAVALAEVDVVYEDRSCWPIDALPELIRWEGKDPILMEPPELREKPIQKCANVAKKHEFRFFALNKENECYTGPLIEWDFKAKWKCDEDNDRVHLYQVNTILDAKFIPLGCRSGPWNEEDWIELPDLFDRKEKPDYNDLQEQCSRWTAAAGYKVFAFFHNGICKAWKLEVEDLKKHPIGLNCSKQRPLIPDKTLQLDVELYHLTRITNITLVNLGCWRSDDSAPSLPLWESRSPILGQWDHRIRIDPIKRCAVYNADKDHEIFALGEEGACAGSPELRPPYDVLGKSEECSYDGLGARGAHQVYKIVKEIRELKIKPWEPFKPLRVKSLGCWKKLDYLIPSLELSHEYLQEDPEWREDSIQKCAQVANQHGWDVFAIHEGRCMSSEKARLLYTAYGISEKCDLEWGGPKSMSVWEINSVRHPVFENIGCYERCEPLISLENLHPLLEDDPKMRLHPIWKCALVATMWQKFDSFCLLDGGRCYGLVWNETKNCIRSASCLASGRGGRFSHQVYKIKEVQNFTLENLGCWRDDDFHLIPLISVDLLEHFPEEQDPIKACARYARLKGWRVFALQRGMCMASEKAEDIYWKLGWSTNCNEDGNGGRWANQVWKIKESWWESPLNWWKIPKEWRPFGHWNCTWDWKVEPTAPRFL